MWSWCIETVGLHSADRSMQSASAFRWSTIDRPIYVLRFQIRDNDAWSRDTVLRGSVISDIAAISVTEKRKSSIFSVKRWLNRSVSKSEPDHKTVSRALGFLYTGRRPSCSGEHGARYDERVKVTNTALRFCRRISDSAEWTQDLFRIGLLTGVQIVQISRRLFKQKLD